MADKENCLSEEERAKRSHNQQKALVQKVLEESLVATGTHFSEKGEQTAGREEDKASSHLKEVEEGRTGSMEECGREPSDRAHTVTQDSRGKQVWCDTHTHTHTHTNSERGRRRERKGVGECFFLLRTLSSPHVIVLCRCRHVRWNG